MIGQNNHDNLHTDKRVRTKQERTATENQNNYAHPLGQLQHPDKIFRFQQVLFDRLHLCIC